MPRNQVVAKGYHFRVVAARQREVENVKSRAGGDNRLTRCETLRTFGREGSGGWAFLWAGQGRAGQGRAGQVRAGQGGSPKIPSRTRSSLPRT
eukprot:5919024-Pyramimonas_sp.AAC.1